MPPLDNLKIPAGPPRRTEKFDLQGLLQQIAESGFSRDQFNVLLNQLTQQIAGAQRARAPILRQSVSGAPRAVRQSAVSSAQNRGLQALQAGTTGIQASGLDRQMRALLALLQQDLQKQQIEAQSNANLLRSLAGLGLGGGQLLADLIGPKPRGG